VPRFGLAPPTDKVTPPATHTARRRIQSLATAPTNLSWLHDRVSALRTEAEGCAAGGAIHPLIITRARVASNYTGRTGDLVLLHLARAARAAPAVARRLWDATEVSITADDTPLYATPPFAWAARSDIVDVPDQRSEES
jgi:hypothetical protein